MQRLFMVGFVLSLVLVACGRNDVQGDAPQATTLPATTTIPVTTTISPTTTTTTAPTTMTTTMPVLDSASVVLGFHEAWAIGNKAEMMLLVADDAVFTVGSESKLTGKDQILAFFESMFGDELMVDESTLVVAGSTVSWELSSGNGNIASVNAEAEVRDGLIHSWVSDAFVSQPLVKSASAPNRMITIDGDISDWGGIQAVDMTLRASDDAGLEEKQATVQFAHTEEYLFALVMIEDDYDWSATDPHLAASAAVAWRMDDDSMDIWRWQLKCSKGERGGGDAGMLCGLTDGWGKDLHATSVDGGGENSLLAAWNHTNGKWIFEICRRLRTGAAQDATFSPSEPSTMAVAFWDPDSSSTGWDNETYVDSIDDGWIEVTLD